MTHSPRPFFTISVAAIVLSTSLSVLLSPARSFAQSSSTTNVPYRSPTDLIPPPLLVVDTRETRIRKCYLQCDDFCNRLNEPQCLRRCRANCR
jgi:hypothetical protein